jgi:DNA-binding transcriptional MerR regulator
MAYTVKQVSTLSGVSVRTLHFYDEIDLLKPAYVQANGYRYYEEPQLLRLQQILFYRELDVPLAEIQRLMGADDDGRLDALKAHRDLLRARVSRMSTLMATVDKTIAHLEGRSPMASEELFEGFDPAQQARYEDEVRERWGATALDESKRRTAQFTKEDWARVKGDADVQGEAWKAVLDKGLAPDDPEVQAVVQQHFDWINRFYTPTREIYIGLGEMYRDDARFRAFYDKYDARLADFLPQAMRVYAERHLS